MVKAENKCQKCEKKFESQRDLKKHLNKKYPCDQAQFQCEKCGQKLWTRDSKTAHEKHCEGRVHPEDVLKQRIDELEEKIEELNRPEIVVKQIIEPVGFGKLEDAIKPQTYIGLPGELLIPEIPTDDVVVKFGSTKEPPVRIPRHDKDFGGFRLLDSIVCENPGEVEDKLRDWLKVNGKLVKGKTVNKNTTDTELFTVKNQDEYEKIVKIAKAFADEQNKRIDDRVSREVRLERQKLESERRSLMAERELLSSRSDADW